MSFTVQETSGGSGIWLVEISGNPPPSVPYPDAWMPGFLRPGVGYGAPAYTTAAAPTYRLSDRDWIGTPTDATMPNVRFPGILAAPVALEETISPLPEQSRRSISVGEITINNADRGAEAIAGDWAIAGRTATIRRGRHLQPTPDAYDNFVRVGDVRVIGAAYGETVLRLSVTSAVDALTVPACGVFGGTGGLDGVAALAGQFKPRVFGQVLNHRPPLVKDSNQIYLLHDGAMAGVSAVRDRGVALTFSANYANLAALEAASPGAGTYATSLAVGAMRLGAIPTGMVTVDCTGDNAAGTGGYSATLAGMVRKLIEGPGGLAPSAWVSTGFDLWPTGAAGIIVNAGTVADALDRLARSAAGWWGTDNIGRIVGGRVAGPASIPTSGTIRLLRDRPQQLQPVAPRYRTRAAYDVLGVVQPPAELAAGVTAAARDRLGIAARYAIAFNAAVLTAYPAALDAEPIPSLFVSQADAQSLADVVQALHGVPRQAWSLPLGYWSNTYVIGQSWRVEAPGAERLSGRDWLIIGRGLRGDVLTLIVWG
jgi:hypothetical protein